MAVTRSQHRSVWRRRDTADAEEASADADLVHMPEQVRRVLIHPVRARSLELLFAVAAGEEDHVKRAGAPGRQEVPHSVLHNDLVLALVAPPIVCIQTYT